MYKTQLLSGFYTLEKKVIESNDLLELISIIDPGFAKKIKGEAMNKTEYEFKEVMRRIFNEREE